MFAKRRNFRTSKLYITLLTFLSIGSFAYADCTTPAGVAGQLQWISPQVKYCNGTTWQVLDNTPTATACTEAGRISYVSPEIMYCNGSVWVKSAPPINHGSCATASPGEFYYDGTGKYYWFCNGTNWRRMGP